MSKYLAGFKHVAEAAANHFELVGNLILIEEIKDEDFRTKSGLIIASGSTKQVNGLTADKPVFGRILLVGKGTTNEAGELEQYDVEPGDIVLLPATSIKRFSVFGKLVTYGETSIGLAQAEDIQCRFKGEAGFNEFFNVLNGAVEREHKNAESQVEERG